MKILITRTNGTAFPQSLALTALVSILVGHANVATAQLLANGSFDTTYSQEIVPGFFLPKPASWVNTGFKSLSGAYEDELSSEPWAGPAPTPATSGDNGVFFKPFTGNLGTGDLATGRLYQDIPATPGLLYELSGWAGAEANYSGLLGGATKTELSLSFYDAGSVLLGNAVLDLAAAGLGTPNGQPFNYKLFSVSGVAPAGTASLRAAVNMLDAYANPAGGGQAFVVDDFAVTVVPEPTTLALLGVGAILAISIRRRS